MAAAATSSSSTLALFGILLMLVLGSNLQTADSTSRILPCPMYKYCPPMEGAYMICPVYSMEYGSITATQQRLPNPPCSCCGSNPGCKLYTNTGSLMCTAN